MTDRLPRLGISIGGRISDRARNIEQRPLFHIVARIGIAARAVIYLLLAYFAADIALHGYSPDQASGSGAIAVIALQPGAPLLLLLLACGLIAYGLWRITMTISGVSAGKKESVVQRFGWCGIAVVYTALFFQAISALSGSGSSGGSASQPTPFVARALRWPGGPELVGIAGVAIVVGGIALALWACLHDFDKLFETERMSRGTRQAARATQILGDVTRGALVAVIGAYVLVSAVTDDPYHAKSLSQALESVAHRSYGGWLIALAAVGLLAFAVSSIYEALYRRV